MRPPNESNPILQIRKPTTAGSTVCPTWITRRVAEDPETEPRSFSKTRAPPTGPPRSCCWPCRRQEMMKTVPRGRTFSHTQHHGQRSHRHRHGDSKDPEPCHATQIKQRWLTVSNAAKMPNKARSLTRNQNEASNLWDNLSRMAEAKVRLGELHRKWRVTARGEDRRQLSPDYFSLDSIVSNSRIKTGILNKHTSHAQLLCL